MQKSVTVGKGMQHKTRWSWLHRLLHKDLRKLVPNNGIRTKRQFINLTQNTTGVNPQQNFDIPVLCSHHKSMTVGLSMLKDDCNKCPLRPINVSDISFIINLCR